MRGRRAWPFLALAALLGASPALAQGEPAPAAPPAPAQRPVLSLVVARAHAALPFPDDSCGACLNPIHIAAFDSAETLYGPPVAPEFGATMYWHSWFTHGNLPMLLVVQHLGDGRYHIAAHARGADTNGMGCLRREEIAHLDWHPTGAGIVARDGGLCASLAAIVALPPRPDPRFDNPVTVVSAAYFRDPRPSLIVARRRGAGAIVEARMADVETLSGPRVPRTLTVHLMSGSPIPAGDDLIMVVLRGQGRLWMSNWVRPLEASGRETCIPSEDLWRIDYHTPRLSYRRGRRTCFLL